MKHEDLQMAALPRIVADLRRGSHLYPLVVEIHPTEICNYRCGHCFLFHNANTHNTPHEKEPISLGRYASLFQEIRSLGINHLSISGAGEPFIDQRILELLGSACKTGLQVRVITNGSLLSDDAIDELMRCEEIRISLNSIDPSTHRKITHTPGTLLETTLHNIKHLVNLRRERGSSLSIGVSFLVLPENHSEVVTFCRHILDMEVDAVIIKYDIYHLFIPEREVVRKIHSDLSTIDNPRLEIREPLIMNMAQGKCFIPYFKIAINPYGDVFSCCLGAQPGESNGYFLANLQSRSLEAVWKSSEHPVRNLASAVTCNTCNYNDYRINQIIMNSIRSQE